MTLAILVLFIGVITAPDGQLIAKVGLSALLALLVWGWYVFLWKTPFEIRLADANSLEFRTILRSIKIEVMDIISIKMVGLPGERWIRLRHTKGKIILVTGMSGFDEFLDKVQAINPKVEIRVPKFC